MRRLARVGSVLVALSACSTSAASERAETIPPLNITAPAADPTAHLEEVLDWHRAEDLDRWLAAGAARPRAQKVNRSTRSRSSPPPEPSSPATSDGELVNLGTFRATCYELTGRTASGLPAGPGRIAVDPRVIPLGTRLFVEGYGPAVAADTGGAIKGRRIDVWRSSCAGYPNPTVTVHRRP